MSGIASQSQLRLSFLRWALVTVPGIVFLGFVSGRLANSGYDNGWFAALEQPDIMPPGWVFGLNAVSFVGSAALVWSVHARFSEDRAEATERAIIDQRWEAVAQRVAGLGIPVIDLRTAQAESSTEEVQRMAARILVDALRQLDWLVRP